MFWKGSFSKKAFFENFAYDHSALFMFQKEEKWFCGSLDVHVQRLCMIFMYRENVKKCRPLHVLKKKCFGRGGKLNKGFSENFGYDHSALFIFQKKKNGFAGAFAGFCLEGEAPASFP